MEDKNNIYNGNFVFKVLNWNTKAAEEIYTSAKAASSVLQCIFYNHHIDSGWAMTVAQDKCKKM